MINLRNGFRQIKIKSEIYKHFTEITMANLILGTVQFGLDYGINNLYGKIEYNEVIKILDFAHSNNITILDTAPAYGESEALLGKSICEIGKPYNIITKYPSNQPGYPVRWIDNSLKLLKVNSVYGYLFHSYSTFQEHPEYIDDFIQLKECGKAEKIGFSLYYPSEAEFIVANNVPCDIVQVPYNIFDQRFASVFPILKSKNIEIHVRSIFLQGLFFISLDNLDNHFISVKDNLKEIHKFAKAENLDISSICFGFVNKNKYVDKIVMGIDSLKNLESNVINFLAPNIKNIDFSPLESLMVSDEKIILPINWNRKNI